MLITKALQLFKAIRTYPSPKLFVERMSSSKNCLYDINSIVWIDMEMTGLEVETDEILEVACVITDAHLNILDKSPTLIIHQPDDVLNNMNQWCIKQHTKTGLVEDCRNSSLTLEQAQQILYEFLKRKVPRGMCPLAGNSVYMDRLFLRKYMPEVNKYLHYRIIDVSTLKELCQRWNTKHLNEAPKKEFGHRASDDILESIKELKHYKSLFN